MSVFELSALPKLRRVGLVRVNNLTDEAIYSLAERHASLERIHLSYCDQISVMAIHFLLQKLHKLTHLSLTGVPAFRQPELQQFCREPPRVRVVSTSSSPTNLNGGLQEFNSTQQLSFCVYSGKGVSQLRAFLTELFDHITELNGTDDTEYEDDDDDDAYIDEDTPEPETGGEGDDDDEVYAPRRQSPDLANVAVYRGYRPQSLSQNLPQSHEFVFRRDRPIRGATIPPTLNTTQLPPSANIQGATSRLNAQILAAYTSPGPPSPRPRGQGLRSMADMLPIVESSVSPPPSDVASNRSEGASQSNRAAFFRASQEGGSGGGLSRDNGTLELEFAEIRQGRGTNRMPSPTSPPRHLRRGHETIPESRQPFIDVDRRPLPSIFSPSQSQSEIINDQASLTILPTMYQHEDNLQLQSPAVWPYREPNDPNSPSDSSTHLLEHVQPVSGTEGRGRSVKRSLRNTFNVAEHYASSFLFGRSASGPDEGSNSNTRGNGNGNVSGR
jgi:F-box and leucine-rich repeat protein GRR1